MINGVMWQKKEIEKNKMSLSGERIIIQLRNRRIERVMKCKMILMKKKVSKIKVVLDMLNVCFMNIFLCAIKILHYRGIFTSITPKLFELIRNILSERTYKIVQLLIKS